MSWDDVDNKLKKGVDAGFVSCSESYEKAYIKKTIQEAFGKKFSSDAIDRAIESCCDSVKGNRPRDKFLACMKEKLGS
ncbi:hypothetical protein [Fundidesulfovibrio putealis]|uniref:hypothetical protein n=1 Tax=Fundidesulfovibrio putealis TaxID=270496 RepID=UPI0004119CB4|nr:hypothetical protein [Fundidesulfovibrio putealis]